MSDAYFGMRQLMEPEGWPSAQVPKKSQMGCGQPIKDEAREERKKRYCELAKKGKSLFEGERVDGKMEETQRQVEEL